mgnify:CR=1 FL=1|jgi:hypothetical protein
MQEASIPGLIWVLIIILGYYVVKWLARIFLPVILQKAVRNFEKKAREQQGYRDQGNNVREGETVVDKKPFQQKESNKDVGEYVDYEEVDD